MLPIAPLLVVLDSIAANVGDFSDVVALVHASALADVATLTAEADAAVHIDLVPVFDYRARMIAEAAMLPTLQGALIQRALDTHYGAAGNGSLNVFLQNSDARVHENLRLIGMQIDSRNVFAPSVLDPVATYEGTAAGTGTFATVIEVDSSQYGDSEFEIVVDVMGAADRDVRVSVRDFDGQLTQSVVTVPGSAATGSTVAIPGRGIRIESIETVSGGQAGDEFHVRTIVEREI
jgi:hypothetical protein